MDKLLIVEDDTTYVSVVKSILTFPCDIDHIGCEAEVMEAALSGELKKYSLILFDIYLNDCNGIMLYKKVKEVLPEYMPISILMSEKATDDDRIAGFKSHFFDFINKSYSDEEIESRISNALHYSKRFQGHLNADGLRFDLSAQIAMIDEHTLALTPTEFKILYHVAAYPKGIRKDFLIERVWDSQAVVGQALNVHVHNLNKKIEEYSRKVSVTSSGVVKLLSGQ